MANKRKRSIKRASGSSSTSDDAISEATVIGDDDCLEDAQDLGFNYVFWGIESQKDLLIIIIINIKIISIIIY